MGLGRRRRRSGSQIVGTTATADAAAAAAACLADRETSLPPKPTRLLPLKYNKALCILHIMRVHTRIKI